MEPADIDAAGVAEPDAAEVVKMEPADIDAAGVTEPDPAEAVGPEPADTDTAGVTEPAAALQDIHRLQAEIAELESRIAAKEEMEEQEHLYTAPSR